MPNPGMSAKGQLLSQFLHAFQCIEYFGRGYSDALTKSVRRKMIARRVLRG
jgi:hypothetical protein